MYLGLDCSSKAVHGVVVNDQEEIVAQIKSAGIGKDFEGRFDEIFQSFSEDLSKINLLTNAAIEAAIYIQSPRATLAIAYVVGGVRVTLQGKSIPYNLVDNKSWKKIIVGNGNAKKPDIKSFAVNKWGDIFKEQDFADAACIALWCKRSKDGITEN